jgi:hypothetical protein
LSVTSRDVHCTHTQPELFVEYTEPFHEPPADELPFA